MDGSLDEMELREECGEENEEDGVGCVSQRWLWVLVEEVCVLPPFLAKMCSFLNGFSAPKPFYFEILGKNMSNEPHGRSCMCAVAHAWLTTNTT